MHHPSLSWEANGVLCWAQTQPTFTLKNLLRKGTGRDRAYRILRELLASGYLERFECRNESGKFLEYGYRMALNPKKPFTANPEAVMPREATPLTANPEAVPLPEQPLTANPEAVECASCEEKDSQSRFPLTANPEAVPLPEQPLTANPEAVPLPEQPLTANPEAAPEDSSRGTENVSHTEIEPLRENPQTDKQPPFFKSLKEEILNDLLSVFNKHRSYALE